MTMKTGDSRHSTSSHRSDRSGTAYEPNSSSNSPTDANFKPASLKSSISATASNHEVQESDEEEVEEAEDNPDLDDDGNPKEPVKGWPKVAVLMAKTPDFAAFSRF